MSRASSPDALPGAAGCAGFTLLEVLVALAVAAAVLAAIGQVMGANGRGVRALEARAGLLSTARAVEAGIPARGALALGRTDGDIAGHRWRVDVRPLDVAGVPEGAKWAPRDVVIRVRAPSGAMVVLETVRLVPVVAE